MPKFTWVESYKTIIKYSCEITDEEAKLFEENPDKFFDEVDYQQNQEMEWEDVSSEEESDWGIEI